MASQKQGTDRRTIYDTTIYEIDVYVTEDADGTLHTEPIAYVQGSTEKKRKLDFHNRRIPSGSYHGKHTEVASTDDLATASGVIAPKTGDTSHPEFYMVSVVLAAAGMILIRRTHKREGGGEDAS